MSAGPSSWVAPEFQPSLAEGELHVWRAVVPARGGRAAVGELLRRLLGGYLGVGAGEVLVVVGERGKPRIEEGAIEFNVSHSGAVALFAFRLGVAVGVDVEVLRPRHEDLEALRSWTRHEAQVKCAGLTMLSEPPAGLWVCELDAGEGVAAAVASATAAERLLLYDAG